MYEYVGPPEILSRVAHPAGSLIRSKAELEAWARRHGDGKSPLTGTFVIERTGVLLVADRHSEHVACAGGAPVLAAGEMTLEFGGDGIRVLGITNQSTGYCPDAFSWEAVAAALFRLDLDPPTGFSHTFVFRRCPACGQINVVKEGDFTCSVCGHDLPARWNF